MAGNSSQRHTTTRLFKQVTEVVRERESIEYFPAFDGFAKIQDVHHVGEEILKKLPKWRDPTLTALAQLGIHLTGTERSFCSLFDQEYQYIITDATPSLYLQPRTDDDAEAEPRLLCGAAIVRQHMPCHFVLNSIGCDLDLYGKHDAGQTELPVTLSKDLQADNRFSASTFHYLGVAARSYAAVPIRTKRGINIGVYCVMSSIPGKNWTPNDGRRMRDISQTIMGHLERDRREKLYRVNERMKRGLGSFVEGRATLSGWRYGSNAAAFTDMPGEEGALNEKQQRIQRTKEDDALDIADGIEPIKRQFPKRVNDEGQHTLGCQREDKDCYADDWAPTSTDAILDTVFSKAANIIRESAEVEGCLFVDASMDAYQSSGLQATCTAGEAGPRLLTSSSDESKSSDSGKGSLDDCRLLAFSTSESSSVDGNSLQTSQLNLGRKRLKQLLQRYPQGKIFNFDAEGSLQTSDSSEEDIISAALSGVTHRLPPGGPGSSTGTPPPSSTPLDKSRNRQSEGRALARAFPGVRSVAFVPVWNSSQGCWFAGGFVYTRTPIRTFTIQGELSYLRAFGTIAAAEIIRLNTLLSEKAKTDALGSLSHELRSPLHGILLSTELMADTELNVFQANTAHTIKTCTHTLLDTIDHLLEYSKVDNLASRARQSRPSKRSRVSDAQQSPSNNLGQKSLIQPCQVDNLAEEVVESVFAGFNFQHLSKEMNTDTPRVSPDYRDTQSSLQEFGLATNPARQDRGQKANQVAIGLSIESNPSWLYQVPVGAIRRIVMNIFGNALKYTQQGTVKVSLGQELVFIQGRKKRAVKLTVQDTGKGISKSYLQAGLYEPFSQEDSLAAGTGLGLSMVKKIVSHLRGRISIKSEVGVGTTVTVVLPLERVPEEPGITSQSLELKRDFEERVQDLAGLRIRLMQPENEDGELWTRTCTAIETVCRDWLHLDIIPQGSESELTPDLVLWLQHHVIPSAEEFKALAKKPNVVICQSPLEAYKQTLAFEAAGHEGIFEFVNQPAGPRKLARALLLAHQRWARSPNPGFNSTEKSEKQGSSYRSRCNSSVNSSTTETTPSSQTSSSVLNETWYSAFQASRGDLTAGDTEGTRVSGSTHNLKLLLVDDNHINLKILSACVGKLDFGFELASNGREAVDAFCRDPYSYAGVLMDISMPVMNGFEATRAIRSFEENNNLRPVSIIALTGLASDNAQRGAIDSGVDLFLTKPIKMRQLSEALTSRGILK